MRSFLKVHWSKTLAAGLALAMLFGASGFTLWYSYADILETLAKYDSLKNWQAPALMEEEAEDSIRYNIPCRMELRDIYSASLAMQGKRETGTFYIVKDNNGYLLQTNLYQMIDPNIAVYAQRMQDLRKTAEAAGAQVLFVGSNSKFVPGLTQMPAGYQLDNASIRNLDEMFLRLLAYQVHDLDMREAFRTAPFGYEDYYYRTDSRYTARAALFVANSIALAVQKLGLALDVDGYYGDITHYETTVYPGVMLGDYGRTAGVPFSGLDDLKLLMPVFDTDLTVELPSRKEVRRGSFSESILDGDYLQITNPHQENLFHVYFGESITRLRIVNHLAPQGEKILLLCDRSFLTSAAYLALMCSEVEARVVDQHSASELEALVAKGGYSLVVVACEAQSIGENMFPFFAK